VKVLIADDDRDLLNLIGLSLTQQGYNVVKAIDGQVAIHAFEKESPDVVILDINMPGASGFQVCETIRQNSQVPILMLTARGAEDDLIKALELGADDYMTKPFSPRTLLARIKALLRRAGNDSGGTLAVGRLQLNTEDYLVQVGEQAAVHLTKLELRLLQTLLVNAGRTVNSDRLLLQVWGHRNSGDRQLLKQLVHRLRQKIEADPAAPHILQTVAGGGYRLIVD
jgi:DNA-binding response OmpR family regulator